MSRSLRMAMAGLAGFGGACRSADPPPPVILIVVDTLRPDYLGAYGFSGGISPAIDRLASESLIFTNAYSPAPWTKPATASLLTSLHPQIHGLTDHEGRFRADSRAAAELGVLPDQGVTLAEAFKDAGYRTAAFVANPWLSGESGFAQGFDLYWEGEGAGSPGARTVTDAAQEWLEGVPPSAPFFLYLHLMDVHAPYRASREDVEALWDSPSLGADRELTQVERERIPWDLEGEPKLSADERLRLRPWRAKYAAGVRAMDRKLGPFLGRLQKSGLLDRSFVVLTSDHGEELCERGGWNHGDTLYDEQLHVPLIVRAPGGQLRGPRRRLASLVDVMPTLLHVSGTAIPASVQGRVLPVEKEGPRLGRTLFSTAVLTKPGVHAARTASYKLTLDLGAGTTRLFDLTNDRGETHDLSSRQADVVGQLSSRIHRHLADQAARGPLPPETAVVSDAQRQRLEAVGYLR